MQRAAMLDVSSGTTRFSSTDMLENGRGIWKLRAMPRACTLVGRQRRDFLAVERDRAGVVAQRAEMQLISVVLPEPFGPIRPKRSPRPIRR
jgi:hypothetical protein